MSYVIFELFLLHYLYKFIIYCDHDWRILHRLLHRSLCVFYLLGLDNWIRNVFCIICLFSNSLVENFILVNTSWRRWVFFRCRCYHYEFNCDNLESSRYMLFFIEIFLQIDLAGSALWESRIFWYSHHPFIYCRKRRKLCQMLFSLSLCVCWDYTRLKLAPSFNCCGATMMDSWVISLWISCWCSSESKIDDKIVNIFL